MFNRLLEKNGEIQKASKDIDFNNLVHYFKGPDIVRINFIRFKGPLHIFNEIKNSNISLKKVEDQKNFKSSLGEIISGDPKYKSDSQSNAINNIKSLYNSRQRVINLFNDYSKIRTEVLSEPKQDKNKGKGLKILAPKQMLQRLPVALLQVKAGNNSESLLNEIRQIVYSLYHSNEITKKVYNNIIKSII